MLNENAILQANDQGSQPSLPLLLKAAQRAAY